MRMGPVHRRGGGGGGGDSNLPKSRIHARTDLSPPDLNFLSAGAGRGGGGGHVLSFLAYIYPPAQRWPSPPSTDLRFTL